MYHITAEFYEAVRKGEPDSDFFKNLTIDYETQKSRDRLKIKIKELQEKRKVGQIRNENAYVESRDNRLNWSEISKLTRGDKCL